MNHSEFVKYNGHFKEGPTQTPNLDRHMLHYADLLGLRLRVKQRFTDRRTDLLPERGLQLGELLLDQVRVRFSLLKHVSIFDYSCM